MCRVRWLSRYALGLGTAMADVRSSYEFLVVRRGGPLEPDWTGQEARKSGNLSVPRGSCGAYERAHHHTAEPERNGARAPPSCLLATESRRL
jgi:hypothetical protein